DHADVPPTRRQPTVELGSVRISQEVGVVRTAAGPGDEGPFQVDPGQFPGLAELGEHLDLGKRVLGGGCHQTSDQRCHPPRAVEGDRFPSPLDVGVGKPVPHATVDVAVHQAGYYPTAADVMGVARYLVVRTQGSHAAVL